MRWESSLKYNAFRLLFLSGLHFFESGGREYQYCLYFFSRGANTKVEWWKGIQSIKSLYIENTLKVS